MDVKKRNKNVIDFTKSIECKYNILEDEVWIKQNISDKKSTLRKSIEGMDRIYINYIMIF